MPKTRILKETIDLMIRIKSIRDLKTVLESHNIQYKKWGTQDLPGSKPLYKLLGEINRRECTLVEIHTAGVTSELYRKRRILSAELFITKGGIAYHRIQDFKCHLYNNGYLEDRSMFASITEKIKGNEKKFLARALEEEAGLKPYQYRCKLVHIDIEIDDMELAHPDGPVPFKKKAKSFPGLRNYSEVHRYEVDIIDPKYKTEDHIENSEGYITYSRWLEVGESDPVMQDREKENNLKVKSAI